MTPENILSYVYKSARAFDHILGRTEVGKAQSITVPLCISA